MVELRRIDGWMVRWLVEQSSMILADLVGKRCQCRRFKTAGGAYQRYTPKKKKIVVLCQGSSEPE